MVLDQTSLPIIKHLPQSVTGPTELNLGDQMVCESNWIMLSGELNEAHYVTSSEVTGGFEVE